MPLFGNLPPTTGSTGELVFIVGQGALEKRWYAWIFALPLEVLDCCLNLDIMEVTWVAEDDRTFPWNLAAAKGPPSSRGIKVDSSAYYQPVDFFHVIFSCSIWIHPGKIMKR